MSVFPHIIYVSKDIERCLGLLSSSFEYSIISNRTPFGETLAKQYPNIHLIDHDTPLSTKALLEEETATSFITEKQKETAIAIMVFKNTRQIERICQQQHWPLLNPDASLAGHIEEKISQFDWLDNLQHYLPKTSIGILKEVSWENKPFILQFNRAHTGSGTYLIEDAKELAGLQEKFPARPVRISTYIKGQSYTLNAVVAKDTILLGNISYQITGIPPFTTEAFATIGNDWCFATDILSPKEKKEIKQIANDIGKQMQSNGWRGAFGIDVMVEETSKKVYLIEVNARQPASVTYESILQLEKNKQTNKLSIFEAHTQALLNESLFNQQVTTINQGAQIIYRYPKEKEVTAQEKQELIETLASFDLNIISYQTTKPGSDYLRIQSKISFMQEGFELNTIGKQIKTILQGTTSKEQS